MKRGEIYEVSLNPTRGSEKQGIQIPCVVVQRTIAEEYEGRNPMTVIVPLTDAAGRAQTLLCPVVPKGVAGLTKDSRVLCQQVRAVAKVRIGKKWGELPSDIMALVDNGLRALLDL